MAEVNVGDRAPSFTLPATGEQKQISLEDFLGKKHVVLSFHVLDFTGSDEGG